MIQSLDNWLPWRLHTLYSLPLILIYTDRVSIVLLYMEYKNSILWGPVFLGLFSLAFSLYIRGDDVSM